MRGYSTVGHDADEITLLCDQHHKEKTNELLPLEKVLAADRNPHNLQSGVSLPYTFYYTGDHCIISIGTNRFASAAVSPETRNTVAALRVDESTLVGFTMIDGHLLLNLTLYDEDDNVVLRIMNNELIYSVSQWDITLTGRRLEIREGSRQFLVRLEFLVPNEIVISRAHFMRSGVEVVVEEEYMLIVNNGQLMHRNSGIGDEGGHNVGVAIGRKQPHWDRIAFNFNEVGRFSSYSKQVRDAAVRSARERLRDSKKSPEYKQLGEDAVAVWERQRRSGLG